MPLNYDKLMPMKYEPVSDCTRSKDTILYALGLGIGAAHPFDPNELKYVYERQLVALPTFAVTLGANAMKLSDPEFCKSITRCCCMVSSRCRCTSRCRRGQSRLREQDR